MHSTFDARIQLQVFSGRQKLQNRVKLRAEANLAATLLRLLQQVQPGQIHLPRGGDELATQHRQSGGLARSVDAFVQKQLQ